MFWNHFCRQRHLPIAAFLALGVLLAPSGATASPSVVADSSVRERAEAALPTSISGMPRTHLDVDRSPGPPSGYVGRISTGYRIREGHTFRVAVEYHEPSSRRLKQRTSWHNRVGPFATVQGRTVYKRAYGGVGSGISVLMDNGPIHTLVVARSPRLLAKKREALPKEKRRDVAPPEAALEGMDLSALQALSAEFN